MTDEQGGPQADDAEVDAEERAARTFASSAPPAARRPERIVFDEADAVPPLTPGERARYAFVALVIAFIVSTVASTWFALSNGGWGLIDIGGAANAFSPSPATGTGVVDQVLAGYPSGARTVHVWLTWTVDLVFPTAILVFGILGSRHLARALFGRPRLAMIGIVVAVVGCYFDLTENWWITQALTQLDPVTAIAWLAIVTPAKTIADGVLLGMLAVGYAALGIRALVRRRRTAP